MSLTRRVCFGIPSVFSFGSKTCSTCSDFGHCRRVAHDELRTVEASPAIRAALIMHERHALSGASEPPPIAEGITAREKPAKARISRAKRSSFELTEHQKSVVASIPRRAGELVSKIFKRGHEAEIRIALRDGNAPLADETCYRSLKVALAHLRRGYTRQCLRTHFMDELGWSYDSAWNEVSLMWSVLPALGVGMEKSGQMIVAPNLLAKNDNIETRGAA